MRHQLDLGLDLKKIGLDLKDLGLDLVEAANLGFMATMRRVAMRLSTSHGHVTSDDLRVHALALGLRPSSPNAWGAIFRGPEWIVVGRARSAIPSNHAREIRVWRYTP